SDLTPVPVAGGLTFSTISTGLDFTCGVTIDDAVYCWGDDSGGQLGTAAALEACDGRPCSSVPLPVSGGLRFASVAAGDTHACGLTTASLAYCWGRNSSGQLGDGATTGRAGPGRHAGRNALVELLPAEDREHGVAGGRARGPAPGDGREQDAQVARGGRVVEPRTVCLPVLYPAQHLDGPGPEGARRRLRP